MEPKSNVINRNEYHCDECGELIKEPNKYRIIPRKMFKDKNIADHQSNIANYCDMCGPSLENDNEAVINLMPKSIAAALYQLT